MVRLNRTKLNRPEYWTIREDDSILPKPYYELLVATYEGVNVVVVKVYKGDYTIHIST